MDTMIDNQAIIEQIADTLAHSHSILFITGAGISADSGLLTYRGSGGLYNIDTTEDGLPMRAAPALDAIWQCYRQRSTQSHDETVAIEAGGAARLT